MVAILARHYQRRQKPGLEESCNAWWLCFKSRATRPLEEAAQENWLFHTQYEEELNVKYKKWRSIKAGWFQQKTCVELVCKMTGHQCKAGANSRQFPLFGLTLLLHLKVSSPAKSQVCLVHLHEEDEETKHKTSSLEPNMTISLCCRLCWRRSCGCGSGPATYKRCCCGLAKPS